jgi:HEAT repeat protein
MSTIDVVIIMLVAISVAIAAVLATVGISSLVQAHRVRVEPLLAEARQAIVAALSGEQSKLDDAFARLSRFSKGYVATVMLDLAPSVTGTSRLALVSLGERIGILPRARRGVRSRRWSTRSYSARVLTAFGVESDEMALLLTDRAPEVRAQAAAWALITPTPAAIRLLIGLLGDRDGLCRFAAQDSLIRIGLPCSDALIVALKTADAEVAGRLLEVAAAMGDERFFGPAESLTREDSARTRALTCAVIARTGNPGAGALLVALLDDPSDEVVLAAVTGLAKLSYWPAAAAVEPLLQHESWSLRKQAAMTLLSFGAPGSILLRVAAPGDDPAADMAIQALELQSLANDSEAA